MKTILPVPLLMLSWAAFAADLDTGALRESLRNAHAVDDGAALVETATTLRRQFPGHPTYSYLLARGHALQGDTTAALRTLSELAARNVDMLPEVSGDEAFNALRELPAFEELRQGSATLHAPVGRATRAWSFGAADTIPEAVAIDADGRVFIGSVRQREILVRETDGSVTRWQDPALWSVMGIHLSPDGKTLWAATSAMNVTKDLAPADAGRSALLAFDARSGKRLARHVFPLDGGHVLGDFIFLDDETLLTTDSMGGGVYTLDIVTGEYLERIAPGRLRSPQGLARIGNAVFVADYGNGLYRMNPRNGELRKVADGNAAPYGIDGLYAHGNGLIAIQNGVRPHRVAYFRLSAGGESIAGQEILLANHADFDEPTLGTIANGRFHFIANSQWNHFTREGELPPENLVPPVVLSVPLPGTASE